VQDSARRDATLSMPLVIHAGSPGGATAAHSNGGKRKVTLSTVRTVLRRASPAMQKKGTAHRVRLASLRCERNCRRYGSGRLRPGLLLTKARIHLMDVTDYLNFGGWTLSLRQHVQRGRLTGIASFEHSLLLLSTFKKHSVATSGSVLGCLCVMILSVILR
jgi:hypothetical protein